MAAFFFVVVVEIEQMQGWKCRYWLCDKQLKEMRDAERERRQETDCYMQILAHVKCTAKRDTRDAQRERRQETDC